MRTLALNLCYLPFSLPGCLNLGLIVALFPLNFRQSCRPVQPCGVTISGCHFSTDSGVLSSLRCCRPFTPKISTISHWLPVLPNQGLTQPPHGKRRQIRVRIIRDGGKNKNAASQRFCSVLPLPPAAQLFAALPSGRRCNLPLQRDSPFRAV